MFDFTFENLQALCPEHDLEKFKDNFSVMLDMNGAITSHTVGFHVDVAEDEPEQVALFQELLDIFSPPVIWAGSAEVQSRILDLGRQSTIVPYFQSGGFIVVLKIPVAYRDGATEDSHGC